MDDLESEVSKPVTSFECDKECQGCKVKSKCPKNSANWKSFKKSMEKK
jgi:hypothetical protein